MAKMDEAKLLSQLQALEEDASDFTWGVLGDEREASMKAYHRQPYGNEEEGWSTIVTSEVQDAVEWSLPALLDIFMSTDRAVSFDPETANDVESAEQATDCVNYVFHRQNNGFLTLYTAIKDMLTVRNCAVMWRKETKRVKTVVPVKGATAMQLTMALQDAGEDAEIESAKENPPQPMGVDPMTGFPIMGEPTFDARICSYQKKTKIKVEAFQPELLLVKRDWTSPLLDDCPYVARLFPETTLSDIHEMGFTDVTAEELANSDARISSADADFRDNRSDAGDAPSQEQSEDESLTKGTLRIEFVLMDYDGDGIAERRLVIRLNDKILSNEECDQVQIATASPILNTHRWDGMSLADAMQDLQALGTELTRQMLNSAYLANNPRTKVLTDSNWSPLANIDALLDNRPGAILLERQAGAINEYNTPWTGASMFPMLEHVQRMGEKRTGVSAQNQADPNAIRADKTAKEVQVTANALAARSKLTARIIAEVLLKPVFKGILKLLTDGEMEPIAFRLRDKFVEMDPNEWRDGYDMTVNVGLGTGDKEQQGAMLMAIFQSQMGLAQSPFGPLMITPKGIYNTQAKLIENAGFKNVGDFLKDPGEQQVQPPQAPPDPQLQIKQMELQADAHKFQADTQREMQVEQMKAAAKLQETQAQLELQAANDARDAERETMMAQHKQQLAEMQLQLDRYKTDADNETRIQVALINSNAKLQGQQMANDSAAEHAVFGANNAAQQPIEGGAE